jgi:Activator of Hsp90 ATPase homolog 1-like protein
MEKMNFNIVINATPEKVWKVLWTDDTYRKWTSAFVEGSYAKTDWKKGSKALFLDGKGQGMVSKIAENRPNEFMSIEHLGEVKDGVEDTSSERVKEWAGAHENYTLKKVNLPAGQTGAKTELSVDMDMNDEFKEMFTKIWPVALNNVKKLSEN